MGVGRGGEDVGWVWVVLVMWGGWGSWWWMGARDSNCLSLPHMRMPSAQALQISLSQIPTPSHFSL